CGSNCRLNFLETGRLSRDRCATYDTYGQIYRKSYHGNVQRTENSCVEERSLEACKGPVTVFVFAITAMVRPEPIPASSPTMSASFLNQPEYKPRKSEGNGCRMRTPPSNWSCIA